MASSMTDTASDLPWSADATLALSAAVVSGVELKDAGLDDGEDDGSGDAPETSASAAESAGSAMAAARRRGDESEADEAEQRSPRKEGAP